MEGISLIIKDTHDETKITQFLECFNSKRGNILRQTDKIKQNENINFLAQTIIKILSDFSNDIFGKT